MPCNTCFEYAVLLNLLLTTAVGVRYTPLNRKTRTAIHLEDYASAAQPLAYFQMDVRPGIWQSFCRVSHKSTANIQKVTNRQNVV